MTALGLQNSCPGFAAGRLIGETMIQYSWRLTKNNNPYTVFVNTDTGCQCSVMLMRNEYVVRWPFGVFSEKQEKKNFSTFESAVRFTRDLLSKMHPEPDIFQV